MRHAGERWNADHALRYHTYAIPGGAFLKDAVAFAYGKSLRQMPKEASRQLRDLHNDDEDPSTANAEWLVREESRSSEGGS